MFLRKSSVVARVIINCTDTVIIFNLHGAKTIFTLCNNNETENKIFFIISK